MEAEYLCYKCCNMSVTLTELEQKVSDVHNGLQLPSLSTTLQFLQANSSSILNYFLLPLN